MGQPSAGERKERAQRRRFALAALGALEEPVSAAQLQAVLDHPVEDALEEALDLGLCERVDSRYQSSRRTGLDVALVLLESKETRALLQKISPLTNSPERKLLLDFAASPLRTDLSTYDGPLNELVRGLLVVTKGDDEVPYLSPESLGSWAKTTYCAIAFAATLLSADRPDLSQRLVQLGLGPEGFDGDITNEQAILAAAVTKVLYEAGDGEGAVAFARKAQRSLRGNADTLSRFALMALEGHVLADLHRLSEARLVMARLDLQARTSGWTEISGIARTALGTIAFREGRTAEAIELFHSAIERVEGATRFENLAIHCLGHSLAKNGQLLEAQHALSSTLPWLDSINIVLSGYTNAILCDVMVGDLEAARTRLSELEKLAPDSPHGRLSLALARGWVAAAKEDLGSALRHAATVDASDRAARPAFGVALGCFEAAALLRSGLLEEARKKLQDTTTLLRLGSRSRYSAVVHIVDAEASLKSGELDRAKRALRRARAMPDVFSLFDFPLRVAALEIAVATARQDEAGVIAGRRALREAFETLTEEMTPEQKGRFCSVLDRQALLRELDAERPSAALGRIIGESPAIRAVTEQLRKFAASSVRVLITGETGTGKELCARALHALSERAQGPFVALNCAALPDELLLSELFGHARGAFTDATADRVGRFEQAHGGTLFLDELGELSPRAQAALLRALQDGTFERIGDGQPRKADVRVIAATHRNLSQAVKANEFREDLFYRLAGVELELPPLRARGRDVLILAKGFLRDIAAAKETEERSLTPAAEVLLAEYAWPGNVRELSHVIEGAELLAEGPSIEAEVIESLIGHRAPSARSPEDHYADFRAAGKPLKEWIDEIMKGCIKTALLRHHGNVSACAQELGFSRSRLTEIVLADEELRRAAGRT